MKGLGGEVGYKICLQVSQCKMMILSYGGSVYGCDEKSHLSKVETKQTGGS